ncbi:hypothetical protein VTL71DRAFT_15521 [Oculimacula yallundae]|uniref:Uncharacterized protein n=1 Tax=Oculimacula yallundae TaxID=86028 RepID=A0ABR4CGU8_9HELO
MRFSTTSIVLASAFLPGVLSNCSQGYKKFCRWEGTAPSCGGSGWNVGQSDDGVRYLDVSTKDSSINDLYRQSKVTSDCYNDYGSSCYSGYKRLWCSQSHSFSHMVLVQLLTDAGPTPYIMDAENDDSAQLSEFSNDAAAKHPHQKPTLTIEIDL